MHEHTRVRPTIEMRRREVTERFRANRASRDDRRINIGIGIGMAAAFTYASIAMIVTGGESKSFSPSEQTHRLQPGETIYSLANVCTESNRDDVVGWIIEVNEIQKGQIGSLAVGTELTVPDPKHC